MKILLWSHSFYPAIGGIETMSRMLAEDFARAGHAVTIVTRTPLPAGAPERFPFRVVRRPSSLDLFRLVKECDVYFHNHISLKAAWPLLLIRRPWVVGLQTWIANSGRRARLQHFALRNATTICCSHAVAAHLRQPSAVIRNSYDDSTFHTSPGAERDRELIFVGRLVHDKGVHVLLRALSLLRSRDLAPRLTIVGDGPQAERLKEQARDLALTSQIEFAGKKSPDEVAALLNRHHILVVPSLWNEPFGIVALEGIACGCVVLGSGGGGLGEAIGACGVTFLNGDVGGLANRLAELLLAPDCWQGFRQGAAGHLQRHVRVAVANAYLDVFSGVVHGAAFPGAAVSELGTRLGNAGK